MYEEESVAKSKIINGGGIDAACVRVDDQLTTLAKLVEVLNERLAPVLQPVFTVENTPRDNLLTTVGQSAPLAGRIDAFAESITLRVATLANVLERLDLPH